MIEVRTTSRADPLAFDVVVSDAAGSSRHQVTLAQAELERLGGAQGQPEQVIDAVFRFLLDREPKEAILGRFDISVIARYFPEFEAELPRYLARADP